MSQSMRYGQFRTAQLDLREGELPNATRWGKMNAFDMLSPAGFVLLGCTLRVRVIAAELRLSIWVLLQGRADGRFMALLAPVCSSFSSMNVATSKRSEMLPWGDASKLSVQQGNCMMSRALLLAMLVECLGGIYMIEQPASSRLVVYPRFQWLVRNSARLFRTAWWARSYGSLTPKRHRAWSNTSRISILDKGKLTKREMASCVVRTTTRVKSKAGKTYFQGNKHLKQTQPEPQQLCLCEPFIAGRIPSLLDYVFSASGQASLLMLGPERSTSGWRAWMHLVCCWASATHCASLRFLEMDWGDAWDEARVREAAHYIRGSIHLRLPDRWRRVSPEFL